MEKVESSQSTNSHSWRWWPRSTGGSIGQAVLLIATFKAGRENGFGSGIYSVAFGFFLLSALRYGWHRWAEMSSPEKQATTPPIWQTPGAVAVGCCLALFIFFRPAHSTGKSGESPRSEMIEKALNLSKQDWFDAFHPIGRATGIKLHNIDVSDGPNGRQTTARFTLYWEGPVTKDGFTKIRAVHDAESKRWVRAEVLETNGTTKTEVANGIGELVGSLIRAE